MTLYRFFRAIFRFIFAVFYRWNVVGRENIPDGGVVLCCNHISNWDPMLLGSGIERQVHFMAKEELFKIPVVSQLVTAFGTFPIKRGTGDRRAIRRALELAKDNRVLGIFPEGTRSKTGEPGKALPGAALIALKSGAQVVPVYIKGPYKIFRPITIIYGQPFDLNERVMGKNNAERLDNAADIIMQEIKCLKQIHN
ncbi:lysophospholipid acyltransferase family protein [Aneurinibacillus sp. Ricciae_BoGa-3]|uniref:lysophospholipid acyltransferase family protein n=1 Tax=Aneurinibacillus sp. Ricciae_BoGa-3 TaxID=3022697 RepID=UPI0023407713|nr:lysophospholipid acyltransferase family protein [Aneurinibacillus sp. Ricciae_BoGa-3]WCK56062.1 lysophospholipid acyltransferase family protein [Aneurinibacillus sp. Ricciae_BoGa-3]